MPNEKKYVIVKNNCALMECYMGGQLAYFFTDKSDGTYYNTLDRESFDCWTVMYEKKDSAEMILDTIKKAWNSEGHIIKYDEEDECTSINEDPTGAEIVKVEHIEEKWVVCKEDNDIKESFDTAYSDGVKAVIEKLDEIIEPMDSFTKQNYEYLARVLKSHFSKYLEK